MLLSTVFMNMETAVVPEPRQRTVEEIIEAIESLTDPDYLRFIKAGRAWAADLRDCDAADLLHEALTRLVEGRRHMPESINFTHGVLEIMRSLADERRKQQIKFWANADETQPKKTVDDRALERLIQEHALVALTESVGDDSTAADVLRLRAEGYTPNEICERLSIKRTTYDSANKRIRRAVLRDPTEAT